MLKKVVFIIFIISLFFAIFVNSSFVQSTISLNLLENDATMVLNNGSNALKSLTYESGNVYVIYSIEGKYLFEKQDVLVGDEYIDKEMRVYVVVEIDEKTKTGKAKFVEKFDLPKVKMKEDVFASAVANARGKVGIYMTHNDESYVVGDGYDSVYGKGGIHDIAMSFSLNLNGKRISTVFSDNLHIPHDSSAYSRSGVTAKSLINNYGSEAIFDIHRDGASRGFYVTKVNGEEKCMVRMVVGKSSANYSKNKAFALFLMSVAKEYCPWLFVDIYLGAGHYNQGLSEYSMLFEMGSHLVEKDLVLKTVPHLADVVSVALYGELEMVPNDENNSNSNISQETTNGIGDNSQNSNNNQSENQNNGNDNSLNDANSNQNSNNQTNKEQDEGNSFAGGIINGDKIPNSEYADDNINGSLTSNKQNNLLNDENNSFNSSSGRGFLALSIVVAGILIIYFIYYLLKKKKKK